MGFMQIGVIKKLNEIHFVAQIIAVPCERTHSLAASPYAGQRICRKWCSFFVLSCSSVFLGILLSKKFRKNSGTIDLHHHSSWVGRVQWAHKWTDSGCHRRPQYADVRAHCKKLCKEDMYVCPLNRDIYIYIYIYIYMK